MYRDKFCAVFKLKIKQCRYTEFYKQHSIVMSKAVLLPRAGGKLIAQHSKDVSINTEGVKKLAAMLLEKAKKREFFIGSWRDHTLNPKTSDEKAINCIV
ncbi:queuosine salvage protein-like [Lingula anatina]|uniref:Queuosine salvage protein-like n=1 Tax=Lingula anatina TaxID=7574 RepID=A0A1S3JQ96_LINAN|nr:queuosine salvage protein-like [Lingula anatina]|eukprot:XP_013412530.1 queuosine salvage protein-like [Lingula anatina]